MIRSSIIRRSVPLVAMSVLHPPRRLDSTQVGLSCNTLSVIEHMQSNGAEFRGCSKGQKTARDVPILAQSRIIIKRSISNTHYERNIIPFCQISCGRLLSQYVYWHFPRKIYASKLRIESSVRNNLNLEKTGNG